MSNNENRFFEQLKKAVVILIIVAVIYTWFLWCKEKPIRFLYSIIIFIVLYSLSQANVHHNQILSN
jgi:energy-coupling factor transporter transmembrane protein EcfT